MRRLYHHFIVGLLFWVIQMSTALEGEQVVLRAVGGRDATLPCGQGKVFLDGPDSYVVWVKDNSKFVYRYPNEESNRISSAQTMEEEFGPQCYGEPCVDPTSLHLKRVREQDGGLYRCRVHYQASPAVDFLIDLRIVGSPGMPKINAQGAIRISKNIYLLTVGTNLTLACEVSDVDGTMVWWLRNGEEIARIETVQDRVIRSTIRVYNVTRNEQNAHYQCFVQNADVSMPLSDSVILKMYLPPLSVEIRLNDNLDFEAGQPRVVDCVIVGCVPPPSITWGLGNEMLRPSVHKELHDGNYTVSSLTLAPSLRHDKQKLVCSAHNSHLPQEVFEAAVSINVGFRPTCFVEYERVVGYVAGQAETINCTVEAYPEPATISWTFYNSKTLYTNPMPVPGRKNRYSSTLTWVPEDHDQGEILCRATNRLGEQKRACVYTVLAGGPPHKPDCELHVTNPKSIAVACGKTWDGGRPQTVHLELRQGRQTLANVTSLNGYFDLPASRKQNVVAEVYASNSRGRSDSQILSVSPPTKPTVTGNEQNKQQPYRHPVVVQLVVYTFLAFFVIIVTLKLIYCVRTTNYARRQEYMTPAGEDRLETMGSDGSFHRQTEYQPVPQEDPLAHHTCPQITVSMPPVVKFHERVPPKAAQVLGRPDSRNGHLADIPEFSPEEDRVSYYI